MFRWLCLFITTALFLCVMFFLPTDEKNAIEPPEFKTVWVAKYPISFGQVANKHNFRQTTLLASDAPANAVENLDDDLEFRTLRRFDRGEILTMDSVSYTHLTLPTILLV